MFACRLSDFGRSAGIFLVDLDLGTVCLAVLDDATPLYGL